MREHTTSTTDATDRLTDPDALRERDDLEFTETTVTPDDRDHCGADVDGQAVVGVTNAEGELLVLIEDEGSIAILPHHDVDPGGDWASAARDGVEGQTGIEIELDGVEAVHRVEYVVDGEYHTENHRVVYRGSPTGGEIQDCKRSAQAGSDGWRAAWVEALPDGVGFPEGPAREDARPFIRSAAKDGDR